jgi:hypothetical protein
LLLAHGFPFNPDSAVGVAAKSEEQTFHSEANGLLPLSGQHTLVLCFLAGFHNNALPMTKKDCETIESGVFAIPGLLLAHTVPGVNCGIRDQLSEKMLL